MATHGRRLARARLTRRAAMTVAAVILPLGVLPACAGAALHTYGSDLSAAANVSSARPVDTAYWQIGFADGRATVSPASGQVLSVRVKGIALANPIAGVSGGETDFHVQVAAPLGDGRWQVRNPGGTSAGFRLPERGTDPQVITTYAPENLCVREGDIVIFNTVGGFGPSAPSLFPSGTPLQIFAGIPNAVVSGYTAANQTNNGDTLTTTPLTGMELLMQVKVGSGSDATGLCPGGGGGAGGTTPPPPPPPPPAATLVQKATIPSSQRITVSSKGRLGVSLFCRKGPSRCKGTVRVKSRGARPLSLGFATFDIAPARTGRSSIGLNKAGRRRLALGRGRLRVNIVAETKPGGATRRSTLAVTLRKRGA